MDQTVLAGTRDGQIDSGGRRGEQRSRGGKGEDGAVLRCAGLVKAKAADWLGRGTSTLEGFARKVGMRSNLPAPRAAVLCLLMSVAQAQQQLNRTDVFRQDAAYDCYKIPYLMQTLNGDLLAFAEARGPANAPEGTSTGDCMDWDITDVVMRISSDFGETWGPQRMVIPGRRGVHTVAGNIAPVQDQLTGRIVMPFTRGNYEMWQTHSDDNGATWAEPKRLSSVERFRFTWVAFGPPSGLQLFNDPAHFGRLVVPGYYSSFPIYDNGLLTTAFVIFSDDGGDTWEEMATVPNGFLGVLRGIAGNECQVVELGDGSLLMNSRTLYGNRIQSRSRDGGASWEAFTRTEIPGPLVGCEGSIVTESPGRLLYSGPGGPTNKVTRTRMTIWESANDGASWSELSVVEDDGSVSYSSLVRMWDGRIALLFELSEDVETVFVPGNIVVETVDTGRAAVPNPQFNTSIFVEQSSDESWMLDDGGAFIFVHGPVWYTLSITNVLLLGLTVTVAVRAGVCSKSCCGCRCWRTVAAASSCPLGNRPKAAEQTGSFLDDGSGGDGGVTFVKTAARKQAAVEVLEWSFRACICIAIGFWGAGVGAQLGFGYDDGGRWTHQAVACMLGLLAATAATLGWRRWRNRTNAGTKSAIVTKEEQLEGLSEAGGRGRMCISFLYVGDEESPYHLVLASNRDEVIARQTARAASWAEQQHHEFTFAGKDLEQGGTWLGVRAQLLPRPVDQALVGPAPKPDSSKADFRMGVVLNVREGRSGVPASPGSRPSRGSFVPSFLSSKNLLGPEAFEADLLRSTAVGDYPGFNLILGDAKTGFFFVSNRGAHAAPVRLEAGVHGVSNGTLNDNWPKVVKGKAAFERIVKHHVDTGSRGATTGEGIVIDKLFGLLGDDEPVSPDKLPGIFDAGTERSLSSIKIKEFALGGKVPYATRSSAVILVRKDGTVAFCEKHWEGSQDADPVMSKHSLIFNPQ
ncbi:Sialidase-1 (Acetylneuraminyl hydrolase) (G9 sialidase) (Lysosomal sialidase) (N-acetyl-alpha-neuraminidase 1) [Durusdinium trenchii]|uniref:Sialidase-1 (Acetylneuraminyl hydrolase) (G9 sialidase) (Lysosomal sialidase) (N-acetyl-alpha-neuraminidase 1) n=1 Tax=Durusdinium trenchii TaxID=1381693 RepID=A0ABP0JXC8_9DINO